MQCSLDGKSLAIGVFGGAALIAALGAMQDSQPTIGRFQIEAAGTSRITSAYVLDTVTGQVWEDHQKGFSSPKLDAD